MKIRQSRLDCQYQHRGVVLIVVLVLVVMLSLAGFGFLAAMSTEYEAARLHGSLLQARQTQASAESQLLWLVSQPQHRRQILGGLHNNPILFQGRPVQTLPAPGSAAGGTAGMQETGAAAAGSLHSEALMAAVDAWRFSVVSVDRPSNAPPALRFGLSSESAKLHLGTVLRWEQTATGAGRQALLKLPGITEVLADSLLDWMDADDTPRPLGAESAYYSSLSMPLQPPNAVPMALHELSAVRGNTLHGMFGAGSETMSAFGMGTATTEQLSLPEGTEASLPSPLQELNPDLLSADPAASGSPPYAGQPRPLAELLTVWSAERLVQPDGTPRVHLNQPDLTAIRSSLQGRIPESLTQYLLLARAYGISAAAPAGIVEQNALEVALPPEAGAVHPLRSLGDLVDSMVLVPAAGTRPAVLVRSPLQSVQPDADQLFRQLQETAATDAGPLISGRISLEEAPEEVLMCIPGLSAELAAALVTQRSQLQPSERRSLLWPVKAGVLTIEQWRMVLPEITDVGDVFQAELIVFRAVGGPLLRRKLMLDAAAEKPRRVHWADMTDTTLEFPLDRLLPDATDRSQENL